MTARRTRARAAHAEPRRRRGGTIAIAVAGAVAGLAMLSGAAYVVVPLVATNLTSRTPTVDTPVATANLAASFLLPARWTAQHPFLRDDELVVRSPDGRLVLTITAVARPVDAAFAAAAAGTAGLGSAVTEILGSGLRSSHATTADGHTVIAAVGGDGDSATVTASVDTDDAAAYRPAIARVLASIRVAR
ncbi:hypothetical protein ABCS02_21845 [Microbacterium sp. X-17]|uniref:hypothetical protein n=1 Tax=Microbacterium sp. X-17 TaxID=3144404 RepID=UPI0031F50125